MYNAQFCSVFFLNLFFNSILRACTLITEHLKCRNAHHQAVIGTIFPAKRCCLVQCTERNSWRVLGLPSLPALVCEDSGLDKLLH